MPLREQPELNGARAIFPGELDPRMLMSERLTSLATLAAGVAHEINNPIAAVLANLRFIAQELEAGTSRPEDLKEAIEDALTAASRVGEIVMHLKQFAREDEHELPRATDVASVLGSAVVPRPARAARPCRAEARGRGRAAGAVSPVRLGQVLLILSERRAGHPCGDTRRRTRCA